MPDSAPSRPSALVTGGARGLGREIVLALASSGFNVVVNDLEDGEALQATCAQARAMGAEAIGLPQDIAAVEQLAAYVDKIGTLDCLVNNAAVSVLSRGDLLDVTPESFDRCLNVNLRGTFFLTQRVALQMLREPPRQGRRKSIITISSTAVDLVIGRDISEYTISKHGLVALTRLFGVRLAPHGIDCFDVRPGMMRTDMTSKVQEKFQKLIDSDFIPARRWGEPAEIARSIANLANGALQYTVGQTVNLDGGQPFKVH